MKTISLLLLLLCFPPMAHSSNVASLKENQRIVDFRVSHVYCDADGKIIGAKFRHVPTAAPVFVMEMQTVPQVFTWVDAPVHSNRGLPHALEHLLAVKGTTGRYFSLLRTMRLSQSSAATKLDFNFYGLSSGTGMEGFLEQFHALLKALYHPDFTDVDAESEFYHFGIGSDAATGKKFLVEQGSVYDEMLTDQGVYRYFFELHKLALGEANPFGFNISGNPDEMRTVTPEQIRRFHRDHYALGPGTGFIFVIPPDQPLLQFLEKISAEFKTLPREIPQVVQQNIQHPKYPIHPTGDKAVHIYQFPSSREDTPGFVLLGWTPAFAKSLVEAKLLLLFLRGLAHGDHSVLYKALVDRTTRELESGATGADGDVFLYNSPHYPFPVVEVSGIPGNRISSEQIQNLRNLALTKIREIANYPDGSESLKAFNRVVEADVYTLRRSERVWTRDAPGFGSRELKSDWKDYLDYLDADPSFVRSISEDQVWKQVHDQLKSGKNFWGGIIEEFDLLASPYVSASSPSTALAEDLQKGRELRLQQMAQKVMEHYHTTDEQEALSRFDQEESRKTKEIDTVEAHVQRPRFTDHPPLTPDDAIHYQELKLAEVPVISTIFSNAPTIDIGLAFDLHRIPRKYYRYLPIFPRCLDSLGLNEGSSKLSYQELMIRTQQELYALFMGYDSNAVSRRAEFTIRARASSPAEFRRGMALLRQMIESNDLELSNVDRLRDLVARRLSADALYFRGSQWILNPAYSLRNADDDLFLALSSQFTRAHWDERMRWALHDPVSPQEIDRLGEFSNRVLAPFGDAAKTSLPAKFAELKVQGLEKELVDYWVRNLPNLPDTNPTQSLRQLAAEVQEDLKIGPSGTIHDLQELQKAILDRELLSVDITSDPEVLKKVQPSLVEFLTAITEHSTETSSSSEIKRSGSLFSNLERRNPGFQRTFPWYVGLVDPHGVTASVAFYADAPGYGKIDHTSLVKTLASKLLSGDGPQSLYSKTRDAGLAYVNGIRTDNGLRLLYYYADRSPDIPSLLERVNSVVGAVPDLHDSFLVDYALRQTFSIPRSMLTFSERGKALAQDLRDGLEPEMIRQFSLAILDLRKDPDLLNELVANGPSAIAPVLVGSKYSEQQRSTKSLFFFAAQPDSLDDIEKRTSIPKLLRLWPSDYWIQ